MKYRAFKMAFLLALATASTVSELLAIDVVSIRFGENGRDVFIHPVAGIPVKDPEAGGHTKSASQSYS
jgi:hypothetical protein